MTSKAVQAKANLIEYKVKVETVLEQIFNEELELTKEFTEEAIKYMTELKNVAGVGGKRLRAAFVYYSYLMHGGKDFDAITDISAAIEIIHTFFLVDDDFMDMATTRRGYPTIHETYRKFHAKNKLKKDSLHFGNSIAAVVAIICDHLAMNILTKAKFPAELRLKAMERINRQIITTGHGQIHDILNEVRHNLTEKDILDVFYWKTATYTYDNPIQVGAIFAGVSNPSDLSDLSKYSIPAGIAFQIQDDILGSFGDEGKTGKSAAGDIKEGKQTLLTFKAYEKANQAEKTILDEILGNEQATDGQISQVREIFIKTGSLEYSKQKALELVTDAKKQLLASRKDYWVDEGVDFLEGIADYMIDREL
ncbi:MAG: polyprenyl synthetase family protein [bacterium]